MMTITRRNNGRWQGADSVLAIMAILFTALYWMDRSWEVPVFSLPFFILVFYYNISRKSPRWLTLDDYRLTLTYVQWFRKGEVRLDARMLDVALRASPRHGSRLEIRDKDDNVLLVLRTTDGFALSDLEAFAGAVQRLP